MKKFEVTITGTATFRAFHRVEAEDEYKAREIARKLAFGALRAAENSQEFANMPEFELDDWETAAEEVE